MVELIINEQAKYLTENYSPSEKYSEYPFDDINLEKNEIYQMVRDGLRLRGYDDEHYNTKEWNPLGDIIKPGQNVVIKPNWVNDINQGNSSVNYGLDCLITNVNVVRAICDYCLVALKGQGKITICDAPIQDCDIELLWKRSGYDKLLSFYNKQAAPVSFKDLRKERRIVNKFGVKKRTDFFHEEDVKVNLGNMSAFSELPENVEYNVPNYDKDITNQYHHNGNHIFSIAREIIEADTIINVCKPKCHRYAGITAAMKNCVGMVSEKETLPHRRFGAVSEGGDSYSNPSRVKKAIDTVLIDQAKKENSGKVILATIDRFLYGGLYYLRKILREDNSIKGCWHGNDTIWRTIKDLNYIVRHADKNGKLQESEQRKILNIGDMIIAGQHNGPLTPENKYLGILLLSDNAVEFDETVSKIMGFNILKMPLYKDVVNSANCNFSILSNIDSYCGDFQELTFPKQWRFIPHDAWKEVLS